MTQPPEIRVAVVSAAGLTPAADVSHMVKSATVYGDRVVILDPALTALALQARGSLESNIADRSDEWKALFRETLTEAARIDIDFLSGAVDAGLIEVDVFVKRLEGQAEGGVEKFWRAIGSELERHDSYALFDRRGALVAADMVSRGLLVATEASRRRARQPTATAGLLARLPAFAPATLDDVLGIREELTPSLTRFRAALWRLTEATNHDPLEAQFFDEVEEMWISTVGPAVEEIREAAESSRFLRTVREKVASSESAIAGGIGVITALAAQTSEIVAALTGAGSAVVATAAKTFAETHRLQEELVHRDFFLLYRVDTLLSR